MQIAQRLYQGIDIDGDTKGLITYMRTDGTNISKEAVNEFRSYIDDNFGKDYLPDQPLNYSGKKAKNAQEAHEAIRPTNIENSPEKMKKYLKEITDVAKESDKIILATDPDREGEAIAWHVKQFLDEKKL